VSLRGCYGVNILTASLSYKEVFKNLECIMAKDIGRY